MVVSPNEMNRNLRTLVAVPLTSIIRNYPTRLSINFQGREGGSLALDQICTIDKSRVAKKLGSIDDRKMQEAIASLLKEMFAL